MVTILEIKWLKMVVTNYFKPPKHAMCYADKLWPHWSAKKKQLVTKIMVTELQTISDQK